MTTTREGGRRARSEDGMTLLEMAVAGAILSVALLAAHYGATLAWVLHLKGSSVRNDTLYLWNQSCRFRASPQQEGALLNLHPDLRPLRQIIFEKNGLEWEVLCAR